MSIQNIFFGLSVLIITGHSYPATNKPTPEELLNLNRFQEGEPEDAFQPQLTDETSGPSEIVNPLFQLLSSIGSLTNMNSHQSPADIFMPKINEPVSPWAQPGQGRDYQDDARIFPTMQQAFRNPFDNLDVNQMPTNEQDGDHLVTMYYMKISPDQPEDQKFTDGNVVADKTSVALNKEKDSLKQSDIQIKPAQFVNDQRDRVEHQEPKFVHYKLTSAEAREEWTWRQIWMSLLSLCVFAQTIMLIYISKDVEKLRRARIEKL